MKKFILSAFLAITSLSIATGASAQMKPEEYIKTRQAGYTFMAWNMGKIKANLEAKEFNKEQTIAAANAIAGIANSGMGALFVPGTEKEVNGVKTAVKPELFTDKVGVGAVAKDFNLAANNLAKAAATGDVTAIKTAFADTGKTCKGCHDKYQVE